ncbi:MAG TPA: hypothetical protein DCW90_14075 [Lachnospiraceae bacterium]|nr:hypothetical protein [Lachnospiraceae bacterium]
MTILTLSVDSEYTKTETKLTGISIINGAQTTGSIGSVEKKDSLEKNKVICRVIECSDPEIIEKYARKELAEIEDCWYFAVE